MPTNEPVGLAPYREAWEEIESALVASYPEFPTVEQATAQSRRRT